MNRAVLIGIEIVGGKPDLQLPPRALVQRVGADLNYWTANWGQSYLSVVKLGRLAGTLWFIGVGDKQILTGLAHLGAKVKLLKDVKNNATLLAALRNAGVKVVRRKASEEVLGIILSNVLAGDNPLMIALDGEDPQVDTLGEIEIV